jgi:hypothetical protein
MVIGEAAVPSIYIDATGRDTAHSVNDVHRL